MAYTYQTFELEYEISYIIRYHYTIVLQKLESAQFYDMIMSLHFDSTYTFL